jgi:hypothetical protein
MLSLLLIFLLFLVALWFTWTAIGRYMPKRGQGPSRSGQERRSARDAMHNVLRSLGGRYGNA